MAAGRRDVTLVKTEPPIRTMADEPTQDPKKTPRHRHKPSRKTDPTLRNIKQFVVEEIELSDTAPPRTVREVKAPPRWLPAARLAAAALGLTLIASLAGIATRSAWPSDETRLLAIAWEMWTRHDWLVPQLNGAPVAAPPLFLWLTQLGWLALGPVEWWPRLVPALFLFGSLLLAARMARFLWPGEDDLARYAPLALLGSFYGAWSATFLSADMPTLFFTLLACVALLWAWRARDQRVWLLLGLALGLGLLASGSLVLLYVLPVAWLAPLWTRGGPPVMPWKYWYADTVKALVMAGVIFAAWALPAMARAKGASIAPLLTAPLATHTLDLFPAARPWWWPLFLLPWLAFPWSFWPLVWLRLWEIRREPTTSGFKFCVVWALPVIALLSLAPVKQPQLLLPVMPAFFLAAAWLLLDERHAAHDHSRLSTTMIFPLILLGGTLAVLPGLPRVEFLPEFLWQLSPFVGVGVIGIGVAVGWLAIPSLTQRIANVAVTVTVLTALVLLAAGWELNPHYELSGAARVVAQAQQQGQPVAHVGPYAGQFQYLGRLTQPLAVLTPEDAPAWLAANPNGLVVTYSNTWQPHAPPAVRPLYEQPYGDVQLRLWQADALKGG